MYVPFVPSVPACRLGYVSEIRRQFSPLTTLLVAPFLHSLWRRKTCWLVWLTCLALAACTGGSPGLQSSATESDAIKLELFATAHAISVSVALAGESPPGSDVVVRLEYAAQGAPIAAFPMTRIGAMQFSGSLFFLEPDTTYTVWAHLYETAQSTHPQTTVQATASTWPLSPANDPALRQRFVHPQGSGRSCSEAFPCSMEYAASSARAGDHIQLAAGRYDTGDIQISSSGQEGSPILFQGPTTGEAIFDGATAVDQSWQRAEDLYSADLPVESTNLVIAAGTRLFPYRTLSDLRDLKWGLPGFYAASGRLYVKFTDARTVQAEEVLYSRYGSAFRVVASHHLEFSGLHFENYGQETWSKALLFRDAHDISLRELRFYHNNNALSIGDGSYRITVQDSYFEDDISMWPWDAVKQETTYEQGGIRIENGFSGRGIVIRNNRFRGLFDGLKVCPIRPQDLSLKRDSLDIDSLDIDSLDIDSLDIDVYGNQLFEIADDAIETDGWCRNVRIWGNTIHHVWSGISLAPASGGPVYVMRNLIYDIGYGNNEAFSATSFKFNSNRDASGTIYIFHNTVDVRTEGNHSGLDLKGSNEAALIQMRNNVWRGRNCGIRNTNPQLRVDMDYSAVFSSQNERTICWLDESFASLEQFSERFGHERSGVQLPSAALVQADVGGPTAGFMPLDGATLLVDRAVILPGINTLFAGASADIGACERDLSHSVQVDNNSYLPAHCFSR